MDEYIASVASALPQAQSDALAAMIGEADTGGHAIMPIETAPGSKLFAVPASPTNPDAYNTAIAGAIADLHGLFRGLDDASGAAAALDSVNRSALARAASEVERLEGLLAKSQALATTSAEYTNVVHLDFEDERGDAGHIPEDVARLEVSPETSCLTRPVALSVSRITSVDRHAMCTVTLDRLLGMSIEARHPISHVIDGDTETFWRELVAADSPISANKDMVDWLRGTNYIGGAAARLRFDFEALTPISEISLKPLADLPIDVLSVAWSTSATQDKELGGSVELHGSFSSWPDAHWTAAAQGTVTAANNGQGNDGTPCLKVIFDGTSTSRYTISQSVPSLASGALYALSFWAKSSGGTGQIRVEFVSNNGTSTLFRQTPTASKVWTKYTYLVLMPPAISDTPKLVFTLYDPGTLYLDDVQLNASCGAIAPEVLAGPQRNIVIPLAQSYGKPVMCRTLWLTIGQPNYTLQHFTVRTSDVAATQLWALALDGPNESEWSAQSSPWRRTQDLLPPGLPSASPLAAAAQRLGGKVKSLLARMIRLTSDSSETVNIAKYVYTLGAWEIDLRYKDYAPKGYWVSKPLDIRGEIRQLTLVPNIAPIERDKAHFYLLPRADSPVDVANAHCLDSDMTAYFRATEERGKLSSSVERFASNVVALQPLHFAEPPIRGTDRYRKAKLTHYPYFDAECAWRIHSTISRGDARNRQNRYDPNADVSLYADSSVNPTEIRPLAGYRPIRVTLRTGEQTVPPDLIGRSYYTSYEIVGGAAGETLRDVTDDTTLTDSRTTTTDGGTTASEATVRKVKVFKTSKPICWIEGIGPKVALYWHKVNEPTSTDRLIDPRNYTIRWERALTGVTNPGYTSSAKATNYADTIEIVADQDHVGSEWTVVAYYRTERPGAALINEDYDFPGSDGNPKSSGLAELALQSYPVTRNVTDYLTGQTPTLRPAVMDRTSPEYYPVYEYYVDPSGYLVFANDFFEHGDSPAVIEAEYDTLAINPRILVEFAAPEVGTSTCSSPMLADYSLLINART